MLTLTGFDPIELRGPRAPFGPLAAVVPVLSDPIGKLPKLAQQYGDIFALIDRSPAMVVALGPEHNRTLLTNPELFEHSTELPFPCPEDSALRKFSSVLMFANGEAHRRQRRLLMPAFQKSSIETYAADIMSMIDTKLSRWPLGRSADVNLLLRELTLEIALRCIFGVEPSAQADALAEAMHVMQTMALAPMTALLPFRLPGLPYRRLYDAAEMMERDLGTLVEQKRQSSSARRDVLSMMIEAHDEDGSRLSDVELIGALHALFSAAFDTSSVTVAATLLLLVLHPKALDEVVAELDSVLGDRPPEPGVLGELVHLDRAIKESMRMLPAVPMLFFRELAREATLGPYTLPPHAKVVLSPYCSHRDPAVYREPARFRPERWLTIQPTPYQYLPFGAGPRACLGLSFANMSVRLVLASVLQRFALRLVPKAKISRTLRGLIFDFAHGLPMTISKRQGPAAASERPRGDIHEIVDLD